MNNETMPAAPQETQIVPEKRIKLPAFITPKRIIWLLVLAALIILAIVYKSVFVAATVDGRPITRYSIVKELEKQSGREALEAMITKVLIQNEAKRRDINITENDISGELKKLEDQVAGQGGTLDEMLESQGVTRDELRDQIILQKQAEALVSDKLQVTDEEVDEYIADSGQTLEAGKEEEQKTEVREGLRQQKFSDEITKWLADSRKNASIKEFVNF